MLPVWEAFAVSEAIVESGQSGLEHGHPVAQRQRFTQRYLTVVAGLPSDTVIEEEIVAFDEKGRPAFNVLQN